MGMFIRKMTAYRDTSPSGLENGLIPYADIRDDYMTFFAFHGILLGAFFGVVGYNQFFTDACSAHRLSLLPDLIWLFQQWAQFDLVSNFLMILLLILPVTFLWLSLDRLIKYFREIPENHSLSFLVILWRASIIVGIYLSGAFLGVYLAVCLSSLKAALFILSFFLVNLLSLPYIVYSNLNIKERLI